MMIVSYFFLLYELPVFVVMLQSVSKCCNVFFYVLCMYCWNILLLLSYLILWRPSWNKCLLWFVWAHISAHCCEIALKVNTSEVHLAWLCQMTTMRRTHNKYVMWCFAEAESKSVTAQKGSSSSTVPKVTTLAQVTGRRGTLKRRRQLQQLFDHHQQQLHCNDADFFTSTPFRSNKLVTVSLSHRIFLFATNLCFVRFSSVPRVWFLLHGWLWNCHM